MWYLATYFAAAKGNPLNLNTVNLILLATILHWRPVRLIAAVREGTPAASGVPVHAATPPLPRRKRASPPSRGKSLRAGRRPSMITLYG
ncbi:hypothetical protein GCM10018965_092580 [Nonomuraea roseola]